MKKIIVLLLFCLNIYSLDDLNYGTTYVDSALIEAADFEEDKDSMELWAEKLNDSLENSFVRFTDVKDSNFQKIKCDSIRSNPDVDSIRGNPFIDTVTSQYGNFAAFDTINAVYGNFTSFDTVNAIYGDISKIIADSITPQKIKISDGTDTYRLTTSSDKLLIQNDASTPGTLMAIDSSGNVGIGGTPTSMIDVLKSTNSSSGTIWPNIKARNTLATQGDGVSTFNMSQVGSLAGNGTVQLFLLTTYHTGGTYGTASHLYVPSNNPLIFWTNDLARMRINANGYVGIDTTTPDKKLTVKGSIRATDSVITNIAIIDSLITNTYVCDSVITNYLKIESDDPAILMTGGNGWSSIQLDRDDTVGGTLIRHTTGISTLDWFVGTGRNEFGNANNYGIGNGSGGALTITPGFLIGIDTITPGKKLTVAGDVSVRDTIFAKSIKIRGIAFDSLTMIDGTEDTLVIGALGKTWKFLPVANQ